MAIHHPTPPLGGGERPRLPSAQARQFANVGEHRQVGPVTQAIRAMRAAEPTKVGHASPTFGHSTFTHGIRALSRAEAETLIGGPVTVALAAMHAADPDLDRQRLRELRSRIADRIEADIALLDALTPDPDLEDGHDAEGNTDDNGIADYDAIGEQGFRGYGGCL